MRAKPILIASLATWLCLVALAGWSAPPSSVEQVPRLSNEDVRNMLGKPDVVIVDISLPGVDGIELIKTMKLKYRDLPALVVSMHDETLYAERALRAGARGYIMKQEAVDKVLVAIRKVLKGEIFVSDRITTKMVETLISGDAKGASTPLDLLSNRELTVFRLIGQGFKTSQIADKLHLSVKTIESYRSHIKEKLRLSTGNDLMKYAIQWAQNGN